MLLLLNFCNIFHHRNTRLDQRHYFFTECFQFSIFQFYFFISIQFTLKFTVKLKLRQTIKGIVRGVPLMKTTVIIRFNHLQHFLVYSIWSVFISTYRFCMPCLYGVGSKCQPGIGTVGYCLFTLTFQVTDGSWEKTVAVLSVVSSEGSWDPTCL